MSKRTEKRAGNIYSGKAFGGGSAVRNRIIKIVIIFVVGLVTFAVAAFIFLQIQGTGNNTNQDTGDAGPTGYIGGVSPEKTQAINNEAYKIVAQQGYGAGDAWFAEQVDATDNTDEKIVYYIQWSQTATNNLKKDDALKYALKAEELAKTGVTAGLVANAAYEVGDRALALTYYKLALERTTDWLGNGDIRDVYNERVAELSA